MAASLCEAERVRLCTQIWMEERGHRGMRLFGGDSEGALYETHRRLRRSGGGMAAALVVDRPARPPNGGGGRKRRPRRAHMGTRTATATTAPMTVGPSLEAVSHSTESASSPRMPPRVQP